MSIWKSICREWRRHVGIGPSFERLARLRAYKIDGTEMTVVKIFPAEDGGCFVRLNDPHSFNHVILWIDHPTEVRDGFIQLRYHAEPERRLVGIYGLFNYKTEVAAYLTARS